MINGQASGDEQATSGRYYNAFIQQKKQPQRTAFSELSLDSMTKNYLVTLNAPICG